MERRGTFLIIALPLPPPHGKDMGLCSQAPGCVTSGMLLPPLGLRLLPWKTGPMRSENCGKDEDTG